MLLKTNLFHLGKMSLKNLFVRRKECEKFNMEVKISDRWKQGDSIIKECVDLWGILKEYNEGND